MNRVGCARPLVLPAASARCARSSLVIPRGGAAGGDVACYMCPVALDQSAIDDPSQIAPRHAVFVAAGRSFTVMLTDSVQAQQRAIRAIRAESRELRAGRSFTVMPTDSVRLERGRLSIALMQAAL